MKELQSAQTVITDMNQVLRRDVQGKSQEGDDSTDERKRPGVAVKEGRKESGCRCCICGHRGIGCCRYYGCKTCKKDYCVQHRQMHMLSCYLCGSYPCDDCIQRCHYCRRAVCISCSDGDDCNECGQIPAQEREQAAIWQHEIFEW